MLIASTIARILIGLLFAVAGVMDVLVAPAPQPGLMGIVTDALSQSHWLWFVGAAQLTIGVLMLVNRFVPVALIMLAAFLYNSFAFHLMVAPLSVFAPIVVTALWLLVALRYRSLFTPIFAAKAPTDAVRASLVTHTMPPVAR